MPNVPRMNSPIAQDSAAQNTGQVSELSLVQRSGANIVENCPESPWLARELDRFYQDDLYDVLRSPTQESSLQEDVIREAKTELKRHDSAIKKHLVKKAALEEKSKTWELDSAVSSRIVGGDEGAVDPFQTEPAIEKRIRELEEASKRQDLAIQKHNTKKAALERGIKRQLDYEPGQPSKGPVSVPAGKHPLKIRRAQNHVHFHKNGIGIFAEDLPPAELPGDHTWNPVELLGPCSALVSNSPPIEFKGKEVI